MNSAEEHSKAANEAKTASQTAATTATEQSSVANQKAAQAENSRLLAQSYAVGGTGTRPGEDTDNAQYYAQQASAVVGGDFISKVTSPTAGNIPKLTSNGQLEDSGVGIDALQEKELPTVSASDSGKVLQVDSSGGWAAAILDIPEEITVDTALSPTSTNPVQNKVVKSALDGKATTSTYTATTTTTWTDATGYYTQSVPVTGLLATDNPIIDLVTTTSGFEAEQAAWGKVFKVTTEANSITLYASEAITTALNLQIKVVR